MSELVEGLEEFLVKQSANLLQCEESSIELDSDVDEIGFDSMKLNQLCLILNNHFHIEITPVVFLEATSLDALAKYLIDHFQKNIQSRIL